MGFGDEIMATGMARGANARGKRIAFGDGRKIKWGPHAEQIFRGNPNIAPPGTHLANDIEWCEHYAGHRAYNRIGNGRWIWNYDFKATPGLLFFSEAENAIAKSVKRGFVLIEPNLPERKSVAANKQWGLEKYQRVADLLLAAGHRVVQLEYGARHKLKGVHRTPTASFRHGLAVMSRAGLMIGPEGGMHHGAAALGVKAVVLFGGFIPPQVTGYDMHVNLTGGAEACGSLNFCSHCKDAMNAISVDSVFQAATGAMKAKDHAA